MQEVVSNAPQAMCEQITAMECVHVPTTIW